MFLGNCLWGLSLYFLMAVPLCYSLENNPAFNEDSPLNPGESSRSPLSMGFSRVSVGRGSLTYKGRLTNFGASPAEQQGGEMSDWMVKRVVANNQPGTSETKGSMNYKPHNRPLKSSIGFSQYEPYIPKESKPVMPRPDSPVSSTKQSSTPVGGVTNGKRNWPVFVQSTGSTSNKPANWPSKASANSGQYRPYTAKPAHGKDEVKQVLVRPNSPARYTSAVEGSNGLGYRPAGQTTGSRSKPISSVKPSSSVIGGSTGSLSNKPARPLSHSTGSRNRPVAGEAKGSMSYKPSSERPKASVSFRQYKPYTAKYEGAQHSPVGPQSSVSTAKTSGSFGSYPPQWATAQASSSNYNQRGQATWQSQATSRKSHSQRSQSQPSHGYGHKTAGGHQNLGNSVGGSQEEGSSLIVIPSHLGTGVLETALRTEREKPKNEFATRPQEGYASSWSWQW